MGEPAGTGAPRGRSAGRPWRGRAVGDRQAERRRRLLDAALAEFGSTGYAASTVAGLAARAGLSNRYFYEQFDSREALLRELFDELVAGSAAAVAASLADLPLDPERRVRAAVQAFWDYETADPRRARVQVVESIGVSAAFERHRRDVIDGFAAVVVQQHAEFVRAGLAPRRDVRTVAVGLVGAVNEVLVDWVHADPPPDPRAVVDDLATLAVAAVLHT